MEVLWTSPEPMTVRDIAAVFPNHAYTTIMTVCDRLAKKGFVERDREGRTYHYRPAASREDYVAALIDAALSLSVDRPAALAHFVSSLEANDAAAFRDALEDRA